MLVNLSKLVKQVNGDNEGSEFEIIFENDLDKEILNNIIEKNVHNIYKIQVKLKIFELKNMENTNLTR